MPLPFRPLELVLEKIVYINYDFFRTQVTVFISFTTQLFALSRFAFFSNFYFLPSRLLVSCTILYFLYGF
jgi:hypothetical protein